MSSKRLFLPYLALGVGILALAFSAMFVRWAAAPGPVTGFYRMSLAALILLPVFVRRRPSLAALPRAELLVPVFGGLLTAFDHAFWNTAVQYTSAANATLLGNTSPIYVALIAWLVFRERLSGMFWLGLALSLTGAAVVLGSDFLRHPTLGWGDLLALIAGVFYAGYFLVTQHGRKRLDTLSYIWIVVLSAALALLVISLLAGMPLTGYPPQTYLAFAGAAIVSQIVGYLSVGYALGHLPASTVSPTMIGQPVLTALFAIPLLGEALIPAQWLGGLVVLTGIYLVHRSRSVGDRRPVPTILTNV